ncbi:MAG TPA: uroporphyrinogen-III synthase, partial [Immundisolibacter sp.]|nr:uroporphyrinogen-III synthase [Immundisolibacter sp.]
AVGPASARALRAAGFTDVLMPETRFDSEGLLALPQLHQLAGRRVVIFRGEGGRTLLADTLTARGADVWAVACYRRVAAGDPAQLKAWLETNAIAALTATSRASLDGLLTVAGPAAAQLKTLPLVVLSAALVDYAQHAGFCGPIMSAREASDAGLVTVVRALLGSPAHPR